MIAVRLALLAHLFKELCIYRYSSRWKEKTTKDIPVDFVSDKKDFSDMLSWLSISRKFINMPLDDAIKTTFALFAACLHHVSPTWTSEDDGGWIRDTARWMLEAVGIFKAGSNGNRAHLQYSKDLPNALLNRICRIHGQLKDSSGRLVCQMAQCFQCCCIYVNFTILRAV